MTKEEEFHELVKEIESQSAYKRQPPPEKKYMSVPEMGRLLGLKKTDRYWLVHKNFFKTEVILGKMRVELESFEKWYANQVKYHKVTGEEPGLELKKSSYSPRDIAEMLQISEGLVYEKMKKAGVEFVLVNYWKRYPKKAFDKWYAELFEEAFYEKKDLDPSMHAHAAGKTVELPTDVDAELLAKVLSNPEMAALLSTLAKSLEKK